MSLLLYLKNKFISKDKSGDIAKLILGTRQNMTTTVCFVDNNFSSPSLQQSRNKLFIFNTLDILEATAINRYKIASVVGENESLVIFSPLFS